MSVTPNQIVAHNLRRARLLHGWTQETAAQELAPVLGVHWSKASYSAAERSVTGGRVRQFTADDLIAFAAVFRLSVSFFLLPPGGVDSIAASDATVSITPRDLAELAGPQPDEKVKALEAEWVAGLEAVHGGRVKVVLHPTEED